jgi:hypothetical protein
MTLLFGFKIRKTTTFQTQDICTFFSTVKLQGRLSLFCCAFVVPLLTGIAQTHAVMLRIFLSLGGKKTGVSQSSVDPWVNIASVAKTVPTIKPIQDPSHWRAGICAESPVATIPLALQ